MHFHIITLFPEAMEGYFSASILGRAQKDKKIKVSYYNPRDFTKDKWRRVDRRPYGGGPGMVIEAPAVLSAAKKAIGKNKNVKVIFLSADGKQFTNTTARSYAKKFKHLVFICGHYEGVDARVRKILKAKEVSIGPYILTGGEAPTLVIADAVARQLSGVLGNFESLEEDRIASSEVYTRPEVLTFGGKTYRVPKVLLSGRHKDIEEWKKGRGIRTSKPAGVEKRD